MEDKLKKIREIFTETEKKLAQPEIIRDIQQYQHWLKIHSHYKPIIRLADRYEEINRQEKQLQQLLSQETDREMKELIQQELKELNNQRREVSEKMRRAMIPPDPYAGKNIIVEIRAGAGGEEAALFAADLYRMYNRFAESSGLKVELFSFNPTELKGFKEVIFAVKGPDAWSNFKYERGVHRVQRVPRTESSGRIHTSTATVAVLPEAEEVELEIKDSDLRIDTYRASGAGGQYVNKTSSAIRIVHLPTGIIVTCQDERSQLKNRLKAMSILRAKLLDLKIQQQEKELARKRRSQIGSGDRSEKIRTYNFGQNRVTDHRLNESFYNLTEIIDGNLSEIVRKLQLLEEEEKLAAGDD